MLTHPLKDCLAARCISKSWEHPREIVHNKHMSMKRNMHMYVGRRAPCAVENPIVDTLYSASSSCNHRQTVPLAATPLFGRHVISCVQSTCVCGAVSLVESTHPWPTDQTPVAIHVSMFFCPMFYPMFCPMSAACLDYQTIATLASSTSTPWVRQQPGNSSTEDRTRHAIRDMKKNNKSPRSSLYHVPCPCRVFWGG